MCKYSIVKVLAGEGREGRQVRLGVDQHLGQGLVPDNSLDAGGPGDLVDGFRG